MAAPSKLEEAQDVICDAIKNNLSKRLAAKKAGISDRALFMWLAQGEQDFHAGIDSKYASFFQRLSMAEADLADNACLMIMNQLPQDSKSAWRVLERLDPEAYMPNRPVKFDLEGETPQERLRSLMQNIAAGKVTPDDGAKVSNLIIREIEFDMAERLDKLELMLTNPEMNNLSSMNVLVEQGTGIN